jgi:hypothetical protein
MNHRPVPTRTADAEDVDVEDRVDRVRVLGGWRLPQAGAKPPLGLPILVRCPHAVNLDGCSH